MKTATVNVSFAPDLLSQIDDAARHESRTRSEFLREAVRAHLARRQRWQDLTRLARRRAVPGVPDEAALTAEIAAYRKSARRN